MAAREKKARRKNIARKQRDADEIAQFRGTVSCVCTCMELDTEKLLPALEAHLANPPVAQRGEASAKEHTVHIGGQEPVAAHAGAGLLKSVGVGGGGAEKPGTFASQTPLRTSIKGSWSIRMYMDVLHAQSVLARCSLLWACAPVRVVLPCWCGCVAS